jgi:outer membrane protein OmpA-like peptidoglycan-associated protein
MAFNLLDSVQGLFSRDVTGRLAESLGEGETNIAKALSAIVPLVLGNIVSRAESGLDGASSILGLAKSAAASAGSGQFGLLTGAIGPSGSVLGDSDGQQLLGGKGTSIINAASGYASIRESSAASLLRIATPAALQVLGQQVNEQGLTAGGLANFLSGQKTAILAAIPTGVGSLVGGKISSGMAPPPSTGHPPGTTPSPRPETTTAISEDERRRNWVWPMVLGILVVLLCYMLARSCNRMSARHPTIRDTAAMAAAPPAAPIPVQVRLPDGTELEAYKGGIEDRLAAFLSSHNPADSVSSTRWFDFDQLNFKPGSAELTDSSRKQVRNIAAILRAYPNARIKIGGYTDKTGNEDANLKLSQQRADVVLDALRKAGAQSGQLAGAQGYGSQFARADADAPDEQRKPDRRISINVKQK